MAHQPPSPPDASLQEPIPIEEIGLSDRALAPREGAREWVLGDSSGGFAMGTAQGTPTRRYHAHLISARTPPVRRALMLSAIDEHLLIPGGGQCRGDLDARLTAFQFAQDQSPPAPPRFLSTFTKGAGWCRWDSTVPSQAGIIRIRKTLTLSESGSGCRIEYEIESGIHSPDPDKPILLTLSPLLAMRDFHELNQPGSIHPDDLCIEPFTEPLVEGLRITRAGFDTALHLRGVNLSCAHAGLIWSGLRFQHETMRQQSDQEDLYHPASFSIVIEPHASTQVAIECSIADSSINWAESDRRRTHRVRSCIDSVIESAGNPTSPSLRDTIARLASASDDFVVQRLGSGGPTRSIIAGYPWFSDWGRDTMIALPGLLLVTGRLEEARMCLTTFATAMSDGLIPNRFDDNDAPAHYNTVDASLWFVHACRQWSIAAGCSLEPALIEACDEIIDAYTRGTIQGIALDPADGLIRAGNEHTQLTWMDALRDGVAFTPRHGKPIEINALWINALNARSTMGMINDDRAAQLVHSAQRARGSIESEMSTGPHGGLVDCLVPRSNVRSAGWMRSDECRPNQIFAVSLPDVRLPRALELGVLDAVSRSLCTPVGLRTLSSDHSLYQPHYAGSMTDRDRSYHNGTVWPWLLGPYCEAKMRHHRFSDGSRAESQEQLERLARRMDTDSIGSIAEIYDAEPDTDGNWAPQGCPSQAWSIAETLRVLVMCVRGH